MITLPEGAHWVRLQGLVLVGEREVSVSLGPAWRCLRGRGYVARRRGVEERRGRPRDRDFRATQGVCLSSLRRTWVLAATLAAARRQIRPSRGEGWAVQLRGCRWRL